jgi:hypothetical protein
MDPLAKGRLVSRTLLPHRPRRKNQLQKGHHRMESSKASTATMSRWASVATEEDEESHHGDDTEVIEIDLLGNERQKSSSPKINSEDELGMLMSVRDECY